MGKIIQSRTGRWTLAGTIAAVLGVAAVVFLMRPDAADAVTGSVPLYTVQRGPLTINVTESGTIKSRQQQIITSEVEGSTTIIYLIDEGTRVKKGDLLVQLDSSSMENELVEQQIKTHNAEAELISAREALEVAKNQARSDILQAELDLRFAKEDIDQYLAGEYKNLLFGAEVKITLAAEEVKQAEDRVTWSAKLYDEKYIAESELESDQLSLQRARLDHELAIAAKDLLVNFTRKRTLDEMAAAVEQAELALERVGRKAEADTVQAEAQLKARELQYKQEETRLARVQRQLEKCKIYAPTDGMVIYATSARGSWRGNDEPLDEGQTVRERQELIYLPTADSMMAEVKVHESNLDKIQPGMPVRITVDAVPGRQFTGRVATIAPLPDPTSVWMNPDLTVYKTEIHLDERSPELRTGMTCRAEIVVDHYPDAVYVPVQAVTRVGGQPTVYLARGKTTEAVPVEIGLDNNRMVRVISGLTGGEMVVLTPPMQVGEASMARGMEGLTPAPEGGATLAPVSARSEDAAQAVEATTADASGVTVPAGGPGAVNGAPPNAAAGGEGRRPDFQNMTPEQREAMQQRRLQGGGGPGRPGGRPPGAGVERRERPAGQGSGE